jgi:integrase
MASIARRPDGRWRARYRDSAGKEHARHFSRRVDAQRWLDEVTASVVTGQYVDPKAGRVTVRDYATAWAASHVGRDSTTRIIDQALRLHVLPVIGSRPTATVRRSDIQGLVKGWSEAMAPRTVRKVYETTARVFAAAVDDRVIATTPCRGIVLPKVVAAEVVPPSVEQVAAIAEAVDSRYRAAVVLLAGSGIRIGELLGLQVSDVDFLRRTVRIERQRLQDGSIGPTKTASSVRTVPIGHVVVDALAAHLAAHPSPNGLLFTTPDCRPVTYWYWYEKIWQPATPGDVGTHELRHFYASALIAGGASVKQVQTVLGHSSAAITLKTYAHLWPGDEDRTRTVIDTALSPLADSVRTDPSREAQSRRSRG